jgi:hypothetical protein
VKEVRLSKMCLNDTAWVKKTVAFPVQNGRKEGGIISSLLRAVIYNLPSERSKKIRAMETTGTNQLMVYADNVNVWDETPNTVNKNAEALLVGGWSRSNIEKSKIYGFISPTECRTKS